MYLLHIEWLYREGDGQLTGMRKVTGAHDEVQSETKLRPPDPLTQAEE